MNFFPEEVVTEILSRLPVKSLLRFKCVSKSWCNRISSKDFTFLHFNNYKPSDIVLAGLERYQPSNLSIANVSPPTIAFAEEEAASTFVSRIVNCRLPKKYRESAFVADVCGPCNGIFCLYMRLKGRILLWNPQIQDFKAVPRSNLPRQAVQASLMNYTVGFCFDSETNDYKILQIVQKASTQQQQLELYSLGTNSWRKLDASPLNSFCLNHSFTVHRKIGWLGLERKIYLFDVGDEMFDMIPISLEGETYIRPNFLQVFPFRESIALVISATDVPSPCGYCEIWMLNDFSCAQSRSWSKLYKIEHENLYHPLGFCGNSYLIYQSWLSGNLMLYDLLNHDVVDVGAPMARVLGYKESLISISGDKRNKKKMGARK